MNLLKTLATISGMTMLSRVTGLVRELLIARAFGASAFTDAFFVAFRIPNLLRRLFAEGAFSQAFVPILAEYKNKQGDAATKTMVDQVASALVWALLITCVIGIIAAPIVVYLIASGMTSNPEAFGASVWMTRIMFPYIVFMSLVALSGGILNTWREFRIPAFTPVLLNISFIVASIFVAPHMAQPVYALAFAVFVGGVLQLALQIPALVKIGMLPKITMNPIAPFRDAAVKRVLKQMLPATFAVSVAQISLMINTNIASHLDKGQRFLAVVCGSVDGIPVGAAGRRARHDSVAQPVESECRWRSCRIFVAAGLGLAPDVHAGVASGGDAADDSGADDNRAIPLWQIQCA